jgi:hypothetical protein
MSTHLLHLPTEILCQILTPLPTASLLRFSETSHHARILANANLHTLSFGIAPLTPPFFNLLDLDQPSKSISTTNPTIKRPYAIWLRISEAEPYDYWTLHNFQSALVTSILKRHGTMLQHLEISIWALTPAMARAIAQLRALRRFSLRIETSAWGAGQRSRIAVEREEQSKAWELLTEESPVWSRRLTALKLENCDLEVGQLAVLLGENRVCEEVRVDRCRYVTKGLWTVLNQWERRDKLRILEVADCGGMLGEEARGALGVLDGLQVCYF